MTALLPFLFEDEHLVRSLTRDREPWFIAADVCRVLGINNVSAALEKLDPDEKGIISTDTLGGAQDTLIVAESGLYTLILRSRAATTPGTLPHRFRKWVTAEVLPTIRKTGNYGKGREKAINPAADRHVIQLARDLKNETDPTVRRMLYELLEKSTQQVGIATPPLDSLGQDARPPPDLLGPFWSAITALEAQGAAINHAADPALIALNLPELAACAAAGRLAIPVDAALRRALHLSTTPAFLGRKTVRSCLIPGTVRCWVFRRTSGA